MARGAELVLFLPGADTTVQPKLRRALADGGSGATWNSRLSRLDIWTG
jgi:hypothetical protein